REDDRESSIEFPGGVFSSAAIPLGAWDSNVLRSSLHRSFSPYSFGIMSTPILVLDGVCKAYGKQVAVNAVSLTVSSGSIFGLLGPNGAGKTSTIRMITGITMPDRGDIRLFGESQREDHQNNIGYMPE